MYACKPIIYMYCLFDLGLELINNSPSGRVHRSCHMNIIILRVGYSYRTSTVSDTKTRIGLLLIKTVFRFTWPAYIMCTYSDAAATQTLLWFSLPSRSCRGVITRPSCVRDHRDFAIGYELHHIEF